MRFKGCPASTMHLVSYESKPRYLLLYNNGVILTRQDSLAHLFYKLRLNRNLTKRSLASKFGTSEDYLSKVETGDLPPSLKFSLQCAEEFGINPQWVKNKWARDRIERFSETIKRRLGLLTLAIFISLSFPLSVAAEDKKIIDSQFLSASAYLIVTTVFDMETTFAAIHNGAHEANPIMKPFVNSGRPATYGVELGLDALIIFMAYEMKKSKHKEFNHTWFVLPMAVGTAHGIAGGLNMRYVF